MSYQWRSELIDLGGGERVVGVRSVAGYVTLQSGFYVASTRHNADVKERFQTVYDAQQRLIALHRIRRELHRLRSNR